MGLFESGMDISSWGWMEWAAVLGGVYVLSSVLFTTKTAARRIGAIPGQRRKARAKYYRDKAKELSKR